MNWIDSLGTAPGDPFSSPQDAAVDALDWTYHENPNINLEFGGTIYSKDGNYYATKPETSGQQDTTKFSLPPEGEDIVVAYYHTHAQCSKNHVDDNFSEGIPSDKFQADWKGKDSYIETPGGIIKKYSPDPAYHQGGKVTIVRKGKPCSC